MVSDFRQICGFSANGKTTAEGAIDIGIVWAEQAEHRQIAKRRKRGKK
jgi:hypothetical protein